MANESNLPPTHNGMYVMHIKLNEEGLPDAALFSVALDQEGKLTLGEKVGYAFGYANLKSALEVMVRQKESDSQVLGNVIDRLRRADAVSAPFSGSDPAKGELG